MTSSPLTGARQVPKLGLSYLMIHPRWVQEETEVDEWELETLSTHGWNV